MARLSLCQLHPSLAERALLCMSMRVPFDFFIEWPFKMKKIADGGDSHVGVHVFIISWKGMRDRANQIASAVRDFADEVTVIYSNENDFTETGEGCWIRVPNDWFYGKKFEECLRRHTSGVMFQIQADAFSENWGRVIEKCREAYSKQPDIGVWAPNVDFNAWVTERVAIRQIDSSGVVAVANTDGVVWSISESVVGRLRELNYSVNNLGWGVEWAAIAYAMANNLLVLRDLSLTIFHPKGSGYGREVAGVQMDEFFSQLTAQEFIQLNILRKYCYPDGLLHNATAKGLLKALVTKIVRYPSSIALKFGFLQRT